EYSLYFTGNRTPRWKKLSFLSFVSKVKSNRFIQLDMQKCVGLRPLGALPLPNGDIIHVRKQTSLGSRFRDALVIVNPGACNPSGIAHSIIEARREIREYERNGSTVNDPAIRLMVYQLASVRGERRGRRRSRLRARFALSLSRSASA